MEGIYYIDTGDCELIADQDNSNGWLLRINGVMSSHIDLADPLFLDFEYMRWISPWWNRAGRGTPRPKLRALHLGGGACSLARYFHAAYPEARQVVVELDGKLAEYVRGWFDLPKAPLMRLRVGEAREVTESLTPQTRDLIIRDVFAGSLTPRPLTTREFNEHAQARPGPRRDLRGELRRRAGPEERPRRRRDHRGSLQAHRDHRGPRHAQGQALREHDHGRQRPPVRRRPGTGAAAAGRRGARPHLGRRQGPGLCRRRPGPP